MSGHYLTFLTKLLKSCEQISSHFNLQLPYKFYSHQFIMVEMVIIFKMVIMVEMVKMVIMVVMAMVIRLSMLIIVTKVTIIETVIMV